ncbi:RyR domain-containing protein [Alistipes sp.]|uniref:RyR domain-containing protein n=1 Tax=Alistipes sp. TaxID=1872444 RepID=UPI003A87EC7D
MNQTYTPAPLDTRDIELPKELDELIERMARNVHEVWAHGRMAEGWTYGEARDDHRKTHPCLVPYEELPDAEREYDRQTAVQTLKLILKLGFKIHK